MQSRKKAGSFGTGTMNVILVQRMQRSGYRNCLITKRMLLSRPFDKSPTNCGAFVYLKYKQTLIFVAPKLYHIILARVKGFSQIYFACTHLVFMVYWKVWDNLDDLGSAWGAKIIPRSNTLVNRCFHLENILLPGAKCPYNRPMPADDRISRQTGKEIFLLTFLESVL